MKMHHWLTCGASKAISYQYLRMAGVVAGLLFTLSSAPGADAQTGQNAQTPADYFNPLIDTHKSRWIFFSSACRPFGMVNLSPDTDTGDDWLKGYLYGSTKIRCFSHIHGFEIYGLAVLPTTGEMRGHLGMDRYDSDFSHDGEMVKSGYHKVFLKSYSITAELTSTTRVGLTSNATKTTMFHLYNFNLNTSQK